MKLYITLNQTTVCPSVGTQQYVRIDVWDDWLLIVVIIMYPPPCSGNICGFNRGRQGETIYCQEATGTGEGVVLYQTQ